MIELKNVSYTYSPDSPFEATAVKDVSLTIENGKFYGLIGHTGSGKTTLVQLMMGLLKPTQGYILIDGVSVTEKSMKTRDIARKIGLVFQYPEYQLFEETVFDDVAFGPKNLGFSESEIKNRVESALTLVGIGKELYSVSPFELSGGQKRRVAIAGTIAMEPGTLILDEPTAGLDPLGRDDILNEIKKLHDERNTTVVLVSHSMEDVAKVAEDVIVMNHGTPAFCGSVGDVFSRSQELIKMGLSVPQISLVMNSLREKGFDIDKNIFTVEKAFDVIMKKRGGKLNA